MKVKNIQRVLCFLLSFSIIFIVAGCGDSGDTESYLESEIITGEYFDDEAGNSNATSDGKNITSSINSNGENTDNNEVDDSKGEAAQPIKDPYANIPSELRGTTVKFATWIDHKSNESASVLKNFTAKTGIKVELVSVPQSGYMTKLVSMIATDNAPDVFVDNNEFPTSLKIAQPLNSYINLKDPIWDQNIKELGTINGRTFIINGADVHWNFVTGMFFQRAIAEENGIKTPYDYRDEGNWNWDTLRQFMIDYSNIPGEHWGGYIDAKDLFKTCGAPLVKYSDGTFSSGISDPNLTKTYQFYLDLLKNGYIADTVKQEFMCDGRQALFFYSSWNMTKSAYMWETLDLSKMGFIEAPSFAGNNNPTYAAALRAYGICQGSKNPKAAGYFLRYFLDVANYDENEVWKNASIAKEMVERVRKANSKMKPCYDFSLNCMNLVNSNLGSTTFNELKSSDPMQIATVLKSKEKIMKNSAAKANSVIKSAK